MRRLSDLTGESYDVVCPHSGLCISRGSLVAKRGKWASKPVYFVRDWNIFLNVKNIYLRLSRPLLHKSTLQHAIELEATVLVDRRECVELEV